MPLSSERNEIAYIRKCGTTIRADPNEEQKMFRIPQRTPFDDDVNFQAEANDLSYSLMYEYLRARGSRLLADVGDKTPLDVAESLRVVTGPPEDRHPVNVGLMFFNDHPEDFFRNARIEVVYKPDPTGRGMEKHISTGPLDRQLRNTMSYISRHIREYVTKVEDRPEAIREFNYPLLAVEEAISNAVYHKGYDTPEPITVTILPDRMEILSFPGPDPSITDEDLRRRTLVAETNRNRRIGEFLKDLDLVKGRNTGVPLMVEAMRHNNSDPPIFETDEGRTYMKVILPVNRNFLPKSPTPQLKLSVAQSMGYKSPPSSLRRVIRVLIAFGAVEYTNPDSPNAPNQRIRLV